ncbi:T9SS type A sorting domain-containing protein [Tellurirhabdus rosea]|uniref:T9SS type A sorting domain-containing protein n=1 Tax=Tellurirhabdus rosea TaxID=2674997 RepID=UPI002259FF7B|nr:T9SS type A sorting domain-containing protein [Tellurirhabdus rosea]
MLLSTWGWAQTESPPKSRLDMGRKPATVGRVITSKNFPFLKHPTVSSMDRSVKVKPSAAINQYYRTSMLSGTTRTGNTTAVETSKPVIAEARQATTEELKKVDEKLFANEKVSVSNVFPNPANDYAEFDYQLAPAAGEVKVLIYNVLGAPIADYAFDKGERKLRIVTRDWSNGIYFYQLSVDGKKVATKKLLIRHN